MSDGSSPAVDASVPPERLRWARVWLTRHDLAGARPTPMLAARLRARGWLQLADPLVLAFLIVVAAIALKTGERGIAAHGGFGSPALLGLLVGVVGLLAIRFLLEGWVRRVDRRAGATLSRRAALPIQPSWLALLGRPHAAFAAGTFAAATLLTVSALIFGDATTRYAAVIALVGLFGIGAGMALRLRYLVVRPVVADDEDSLTADVIMRIEDARDAASPTLLWSLPLVLLFGTAPGWWQAAAIAVMLLGMVAFIVLNLRVPRSVTAARRAMVAR
jgi:hypothetical protein